MLCVGVTKGGYMGYILANLWLPLVSLYVTDSFSL